MTFKIGMDFGTTNSTVSYINASGRPEAFRFPGPEGNEYIPSCAAYEADGNIHIGRAALDFAGDSEVLFCSNLKMILPLKKSEQSAYGWPGKKSPEEVIADYLRHLLSLPDGESGSFISQKGEISGLVLSVPHVWAKGMDHAGRSRLQDIVQEKLKRPLIRLISEPVAAAAYYAWQYQKENPRPFCGNLLICDMGGGTFDVTLCRVEPGKVEELYNDGNGRSAMGRAGVRFDRRLIWEKLREKAENIAEDSPEYYEIYNKLQDYKANHHPKITQSIINAVEEPDLREKPILRAGKYTFHYQDIKTAFQDIDIGITDVMQRFRKTVDEKGFPIDAVFFCGGFAQFYPVRQSICKSLGMKNGDTRLIRDEKKEISRFAISYGAALVANDLISVEERYEHSIGIEGYTLCSTGTSGEFMRKECRIPIIIGGKTLSEYEKVRFAEYEVRAHNESPDVIIYADPESKNRIVKEKLPESLNIRLPNAAFPGNRWKVGMRINKSKVVYLVLEDTQGNRAEYELGDIIRKIFGGLEIITGKENA